MSLFYIKTLDEPYRNKEVPTFESNLAHVEKLTHLVGFFSHKLNVANVEYLPGDRKDSILIKLDFGARQNYIFYPLYNAFRYPNQTFIGYNYASYPKSSLFKAFTATQLRANLGEEMGVSLHQQFKKYKDLDIEYRESLSTRKLGVNVSEVKRASTFTFTKNLLDQANLESTNFPFHAFCDETKQLFVSVGSKRRRNNIETAKASPALLKHALNQDKLLCIKLGFFQSDFKEYIFNNGHTTEVSAEYSSDQLNTSFLHLKAHYRRFASFWDHYSLQAHVKADKLVGLGDHTTFSVNDTVMLRNFKGVKDVGIKHYSNEPTVTKGKSTFPVGDCLGHLSAIELG